MPSAVESLSILESLSGDPSDESQLELMHRITDLFLLTSDKHRDKDAELFALALDKVAYRLDPKARQELSARLADVDKAPHELIVKLANDQIIVAQPVLEKSPCLTDIDLSSIIEAKGTDHQIAICHRPALTVAVTDSLIRSGEEAVLCAVAENEAADFSSEGFHTLSERAKTLQVLDKTLNKRSNVPNQDFKGMTQLIKQKIKDELMHKVSEIVDLNIGQLVEAKLAEVSREQVRTQMQNVTDTDISQAFKLSKTALSRSHDPKRDLNEFALTGHARARRISETVKTLSALAHISPQMAAHCLFSADLAALGILCKANQFSREAFAALLQLRVIRKKLPKSVMADALQRYDVLGYEKALKVMDFLEERLKKESENVKVPEDDSEDV